MFISFIADDDQSADAEACPGSPVLTASTDTEGQVAVYSVGQVSPSEFEDFFYVEEDSAAGTAVVACERIPRFGLAKDVRVSVVVEVSFGAFLEHTV